MSDASSLGSGSINGTAAGGGGGAVLGSQQPAMSIEALAGTLWAQLWVG